MLFPMRFNTPFRMFPLLTVQGGFVHVDMRFNFENCYNFHLRINRGAGAFVCGDGSALTAAIEGRRGMPRVKPPRTVEQGLWARPTILNNVETFACVPVIIRRGSGWFRFCGYAL